MEKDYTEKDLELSLKRAFVDKKYETILYDGWIARNPFMHDVFIYGTNQGWLEVASEINEEQYTAINYRLSEKGKDHFDLK
jgi:hypothetical protein